MRTKHTEKLIDDLRELGGWMTTAEAVEAALSFYRWALMTELGGRFFHQARGNPDVLPVRVLRNVPNPKAGETSP